MCAYIQATGKDFGLPAATFFAAGERNLVGQPVFRCRQKAKADHAAAQVQQNLKREEEQARQQLALLKLRFGEAK